MSILTLKQGEAKTLTLTVTDAYGNAVDLSGASLFLGVKQRGDSEYAFSKDSDDSDFDTSQAEEGIVSVNLAEADTNQTPGPYIGELRCTWTGTPDTIEKSADFFLRIQQAIIPVPSS